MRDLALRIPWAAEKAPFFMIMRRIRAREKAG